MTTRRRAAIVEPLLDYLQNPSPTHDAGLRVLGCRGGTAPDAIPLAKNLQDHEGAGEGRARWSCAPASTAARTRRAGSSERATAAGLEIDRQAVTTAARARRRRSPGGSAPTSRSCCCLLRARAGSRWTTSRRSPAPRTPRRRLGAGARARAQATPARHCASCRRRSTTGACPFQILGQIGYAVRTPPPRGRFPARRVPAAVDALFRTDVAMKSSGGDPRVLLERLIVELCG